MTSTLTNYASKIGFGLTAMIIAAMALGSTAAGDEFDRIDNLARKIQRKTRLLLKETVHYRHTAQYRSLVRETSALHSAASHVHDVAHFNNNLHHLEADLATMDRCFHRLEDLFDATECEANRGRGHIHGPTGHVKGLLNSIENSIHQIRRDVRRLQQRIERRRPVYVPTAPATRPIYSFYPNYRPPVSPGCGYGARTGGFSFSIGGGSSALNFGF